MRRRQTYNFAITLALRHQKCARKLPPFIHNNHTFSHSERTSNVRRTCDARRRHNEIPIWHYFCIFSGLSRWLSHVGAYSRRLYGVSRVPYLDSFGARTRYTHVAHNTHFSRKSPRKLREFFLLASLKYISAWTFIEKVSIFSTQRSSYKKGTQNETTHSIATKTNTYQCIYGWGQHVSYAGTAIVSPVNHLCSMARKWATQRVW